MFVSFCSSSLHPIQYFHWQAFLSPVLIFCLCFYGVWRGFSRISVGFDKERKKLKSREAKNPLKSYWNSSKRHNNTSYTNNRTGKSIFLFSPYFELFCALLYSHTNLFNNAVLRNVMLTVTKGAWATFGTLGTSPHNSNNSLVFPYIDGIT